MEKTGFENLRIYRLSEELADLTWKVVTQWQSFAKGTLGKQMVNAADSVGANIAEGTGRGSYAENRRIAKIARGSLFEVKHWLRRSYKRKLLAEQEIEKIKFLIEELIPKLSAYIRSIGTTKANNVSGQS
jgi:four helix bundle protein